MVRVTIGNERFAPGWLLFWVGIVAGSLWFLYDSYVYATTREFWPGVTFWNRTVWYGAHIVVASPILLIAPLQFLAGLRRSRPQVHRWLGRIFLGACLIAAPLGIFLGTSLRNEGSRLPIILLGLAWTAVSTIAWLAARRKDFVTHRGFVIRSLALGLAFVWIRVLDAFSLDLLGFIPDEPSRQTTQEWIAFALPLLVVEAWLTWWPAWSKNIDRKGANT
jgi:Predicted membrane protein (DUF2306)